MLGGKDVFDIHLVLNECHELDGLNDFKSFISTKVRRVLPHEIAVCGLGEIRSRRVLRLINVDFPSGYLQKAIRPGQVITSSPLKDWICQRVPVVTQLDQVADTQGSPWYASAAEYGVRSLACHGVVDVSSTLFSYFVFGNLAPRSAAASSTLLNLVVPHLHAALARILAKEQLKRAFNMDDDTSMPLRHAEQRSYDLVRFDVTERERQVLQWIAAGKSNWEIGKILRISEFTVKNHVQNVLKKLSVTSRAQAVTKAISFGLICDDLLTPDLVDGQ